MKLKGTAAKLLTNKWVLNIVSILALLNAFGYMITGNFDQLFFFLVVAVLIRYFSKNMIIVLGASLIVSKIVSFNASKFHINVNEGMENNKQKETHTETQDSKNKKALKKALDEKKSKEEPVIDSYANQHEDEAETKENAGVSSLNKKKAGFEVGRRKNGGTKIDYASTIEDAYDELNNLLGSDGIKNLTNDTQSLMKQQMELAESMKSMTPLVESLMPMAQKMQDMMANMDNGKGGGIMEMANKIAGLGGKKKL
jgi:hypothetical protein